MHLTPEQTRVVWSILHPNDLNAAGLILPNSISRKMKISSVVPILEPCDDTKKSHSQAKFVPNETKPLQSVLVAESTLQQKVENSAVRRASKRMPKSDSTREANTTGGDYIEEPTITSPASLKPDLHAKQVPEKIKQLSNRPVAPPNLPRYPGASKNGEFYSRAMNSNITPAEEELGTNNSILEEWLDAIQDGYGALYAPIFTALGANTANSILKLKSEKLRHAIGQISEKRARRSIRLALRHHLQHGHEGTFKI